MALTQPKCPSISFLYRLVQPASLRLWNSSFMSGSPVSSLRDRKPTEERIPQPFSSFIFIVQKQRRNPLCFSQLHPQHLFVFHGICCFGSVESTLWWITRWLQADIELYRRSPVLSVVPATASCSDRRPLSHCLSLSIIDKEPTGLYWQPEQGGQLYSSKDCRYFTSFFVFF